MSPFLDYTGLLGLELLVHDAPKVELKGESKKKSKI